jgi:hypothetical protein
MKQRPTSLCATGCFAATMPTIALPETSGRCRGYIGPWSAAGNACWAGAVGRDRSHGKCSIGSSSGIRYCDQSYISHTGSYRLSRCCEPIFEERSAGNPHATFCGSRRWATASGDPVVRGNPHSYRDLTFPADCRKAARARRTFCYLQAACDHCCLKSPFSLCKKTKLLRRPRNPCYSIGQD